MAFARAKNLEPDATELDQTSFVGGFMLAELACLDCCECHDFHEKQSFPSKRENQ